MVKCKSLTEMLTDYLDGQLPIALRLDVSLHLALCRHCRAYVGQMKTTIKLLRQLSSEYTPGRASGQREPGGGDKRFLFFHAPTHRQLSEN